MREAPAVSSEAMFWPQSEKPIPKNPPRSDLCPDRWGSGGVLRVSFPGGYAPSMRRAGPSSWTFRFSPEIRSPFSQGRLRVGRITREYPPPRALARTRFIGVPASLVGSSFYSGSSAEPARPDHGLGTWRPILRVLGPLPARMGRPRFATRIHLTFRNLACWSLTSAHLATIAAAVTTLPGSKSIPSFRIL